MKEFISNLNIVGILNVGFSGFCFLMVYLACLLLHKEQSKKDPNQDILKAIIKFLYFGLVFGILVLLWRIIPHLMFSEKDRTISKIALTRDLQKKNIQLASNLQEKDNALLQLRSKITKLQQRPELHKFQALDLELSKTTLKLEKSILELSQLQSTIAVLQRRQQETVANKNIGPLRGNTSNNANWHTLLQRALGKLGVFKLTLYSLEKKNFFNILDRI